MKSQVACMMGLLAAAAQAYPPGSPMTEFGPRAVGVGVFIDHSGQELFESDLAASVLNTAGLNLDYGPWPFLQVGVFAGAAEFDVEVRKSKKADPAATAFETGYSKAGGGSAKLASPRFLRRTTRFVAYGSVAYFNAEDEAENVKKGFTYTGGGAFQVQFLPSVNLVLGGEYFLLQGGQTSRLQKDPEPFGNRDFYRGLVGLEFYFKGKNRPFISIAFRPTGAVGWRDGAGMNNGSISVSLGSITQLPAARSNPDSFGDDDIDF